LIGRILGSFRIVEQVGEGAMGVVYRAHDERLHRDVAIKVLPPRSLSDGAARRSFRHEAIALSRLNHPAIATVHDFQTAEDMDLLIMEYVLGESLDRRLSRGPLPEAEVVSLGVQMAEGLAEAHRQSIVHRDLKPGNLRVTPDGRLKILDFGLARWLFAGSGSPTELTANASPAVAGTPAYLAPEVLQGVEADARSDLYAAGLVLYQAATGSLPFPGLSAAATMAATLHEKPPPPRQRNSAISSGLENVILRCLEKAPERRPPSASALSTELRRLASGSAPQAPSARALRLRPLAYGAAFAVALVAARFALPGILRGFFPPPLASIQSLAVLPLVHRPSDPEKEYVADGMTEALIAQLSSVHTLRVISLTSVMRYKGTHASMPEIASQLGVDAVVEGSIESSRGRLRTTVHLIAAREDQQLWSAHYDGDTTDVLELQSRVARAIASEIRVRLSRDERARLAKERGVDAAAYQDYLRGRYHWNQRTDGGIRLAIQYFESALARDSTYALAYAGLADAWAASGLYGLTTPLEARERAFAAASRAVALDPELAEAHTSLAHVLHNFDWRWAEAEEEYRRAIALNHSNAVAHHFYSHLLAQEGRLDEARQTLSVAQELDPLSLPIVLAGANQEYLARRYDAALEGCRRAAELDSLSALEHRMRAAILDRQGRERDAITELARSFELRGDRNAAAALTRTYEAAGLRGALELLIAGMVRKRSAGVYEPAEHVAELHARLGHVDEAMRWLEVAFGEHDTELNRLKMDPLFDPLRSDRRFQDLLHRIGLDSLPARS
jgi:serine/threonine-protein kinase